MTLAVQVALKGEPGFDAWYEAERDQLRANAGARWFHILRNANQHEGTWNIVAGSAGPRGVVTHWAVAKEGDLEEVDVIAAAEKHQALLTDFVRRAAARFPKVADPLWLFDEDNLAAEGDDGGGP